MSNILKVVLLFMGSMMLLGWWKNRNSGGGAAGLVVPSGNLPRSIRLNNPLGMIYSEFNKWQGQTGSDGYLCIFESPEFGIRAGMINLRNGYFKKGFNTIEKIIRKYVGTKAPENVVQNYINKVAKGLNISKDTPMMAGLIPALAYELHIFEAGGKYFEKSDFTHIYSKYNI